MKFSKFLVLVLAVAMIVGLVSGCSGKTDDKDKIKVGLVTDVGGVNDQSFNQSAWEGLQKAEDDVDVKVSYQESKQDADYEPNLETLLDAGNKLIWGIGFKLDQAILNAATANPDVNYAIIDFSYGDTTPANVVGIEFKAEQPSFLVGYIAGKMTKTNKIGFIGGMDVPVINGFQVGFRAGVKFANPDAEVLEQFAESFGDAAKGKAIATQMYQQGADIVFHAAGDVGGGVIEAAKEQNKYAIGVDKDQNFMAPDHVITSAMKRVDVAVYDITKLMAEGKFPGGKTIVYSLKEKGVGIAPTSDKHVPKDILDEVADLEKDIIDGKIVVPYNEDTYTEFLKTIK